MEKSKFYKDQMKELAMFQLEKKKPKGEGSAAVQGRPGKVCFRYRRYDK